MTDDPGQRAVELNVRARLLRDTAARLRFLSAFPSDTELIGALNQEAGAVATEAMQLVLETGAVHNEVYYHDDAGWLGVGWAGWVYPHDNEADR